jgi:hypothetical protein
MGFTGVVHMRSSDVLAFTTCSNERENIGKLFDEIVEHLPHADILVVDDSSRRHLVIIEKRQLYPQLRATKRPRKLGIGSTHKYALLYAAIW